MTVLICINLHARYCGFAGVVVAVAAVIFEASGVRS
jgi:hypothetical protein